VPTRRGRLQPEIAHGDEAPYHRTPQSRVRSFADHAEAFVLSSLAIATLVAATQAPLVRPPGRIPLPRPAANAARATSHANHTAGGTLDGNVLTIALDVVESGWKPEGDDDPEVPVFAFAERGKAPLVPGPLIRVTQGTEIRLSLRNTTDTTLTFGGFQPRVQMAAEYDTLTLKPGESRELRYRLQNPGTYFYWGAFEGTNWSDRLWKDSQLNGAVIVDPPGGSPTDQIFVISEWFHPYDDNRPFEIASVINGKAFPYTERVTMQQGDSMHFRVLNTISLHHPMHLHGFYYRVLARGQWNKDGPIAPAMQPMLNTDLLPPGGTLTLSFKATTPGNWLFHCHFSFHMDEDVTLSGSPKDSAAAMAMADHGGQPPMEHRMHGLVVGLHVNPAAGHVAYNEPNARDIRLLVQRKEKRLLESSAPAYGFVVQKGDSVPARDSVEIPGPVLELERGKPVRIHVVNNLAEPTGIHWHGLEIESFPDGVANWSGMGDHVFPPVAPGAEFIAAFTPPRAGTFPYHSHLNERHQIQSGMYGALIVTDKPRDLAHDHLIVAGGGGPAVLHKIESPYALVNGSRSPDPIRLTVGETHRVRIVSVHPDWRIAFTLRNDSATVRWRAVAKDGHDYPPAQATQRLARVEMGPGETADFEVRPTQVGEWILEVKTVESGWYIPVPVIISKPEPRKR
jgi:FtsP/CotA-like multicopper oxidase with cupredoxin domain